MADVQEHLVLDSRLDELDRLADAIGRLCTAAHRPGETAAFALCAEELFTNIVVHGHGGTAGHAIDVLLGTDDAMLTVELIDDAPAFDPTTPASPDLDGAVEDRPIGGLGRHLVSTLMERFCYRRDGDRNRVCFGRATREDEAHGDRG